MVRIDVIQRLFRGPNHQGRCALRAESDYRFQYVAVVIFAGLLVGFWILQVYDHEANSELAERNRIKTVPVPAPRGKLLDREGRVIVDNHSSFTAMLSQETLKNRTSCAHRAGARRRPRRSRSFGRQVLQGSKIRTDPG